MLNTITIMGRLVRDPEARSTMSTPCTTFTLAVDRDYKTESGESVTDFIDVVAWRGAAEIVQRYFTKGRMAVVVGRLETRRWTANDGTSRKAVQVNAERVYFADSKPQQGDADDSAFTTPAESGFTAVNDEELPF